MSIDALEERPPIEIAPRDQWDDGNHDLTAWCPTCACRALPIGHGICGFCDTPIAGEALRIVQRRMQQERERRVKALKRKPKPTVPAPLPGRRFRHRKQTAADVIGLSLSRLGPQTRAELQRQAGASKRSMAATISRLLQAGYIEQVGVEPTRGCPAPVYGICTDVQWWLS